MTKWTSFIPHTYVYPGQRYTLTYGSLVETKGNDTCYVLLCEWTKNPESGSVKRLCDVPYSETGGKVSFEIPSDLDKNYAYTILIPAGRWGYNSKDFSATMTDYKITCDDGGFVPVTKMKGTYDYVPTSDDAGHKLVAVVSWINHYYTIAQRTSNPIDVK